MRSIGLALIASAVSLSSGDAVFAHPWDVGAEIVLGDARLTTVRDTETVFEMTTFKDRAEWDDYAKKLRLRILVACGLWPEPERTPLNARVFDTIDHSDYTVSKVHFEAFPGYLVTGNLYAPKRDGRFPAVLCPHGHWENGRLEDSERGSVPARAVTFARMGIVAFTVDMVGYNDSRQFSFAWAHRPGEVPQDVRRAQELWGIHAFALQLWGNIRALDFLQSLPNVDPERLACTGASGGGTQTFALSAVNPRVDVAAPVNMISHTMQGGCQCENAPILRFGASNMEIGALFAPKPLMLVSATGDWTKATPTVEYPAIRSVYELYDMADHVHTHQIDAPHNYNQASREQVYRFFGKWFLNQPDKYADFSEPTFKADQPERVRVFPGEGPLPDHPTQDDVVAAMIAERRGRIASAIAKRGNDPAFVGQYREAVESIIDAAPPKVATERLSSEKKDGYSLERWVLRDTNSGAVVPTVLLIPEVRKRGGATLFVDPRGKSALSDDAGKPNDDLNRSVVERGGLVAAIDVFTRGEMAGAERKLGNFPDTFVPTGTASRVQDVRVAIEWLSGHAGGAPVEVVGIGAAQPWCAMGVALARAYATTHVELTEFMKSDAEWVASNYIPCLQSLGGPLTIAVTLAPGRVTGTGPVHDKR